MPRLPFEAIMVRPDHAAHLVFFRTTFCSRSSKNGEPMKRTGQDQIFHLKFCVAAAFVVKLSGEAPCGQRKVMVFDQRYARPDRGGSERARRRAASRSRIVRRGGKFFFSRIEGADKGIRTLPVPIRSACWRR